MANLADVSIRCIQSSEKVSTRRTCSDCPFTSITRKDLDDLIIIVRGVKPPCDSIAQQRSSKGRPKGDIGDPHRSLGPWVPVGRNTDATISTLEIDLKDRSWGSYDNCSDGGHSSTKNVGKCEVSIYPSTKAAYTLK